MISHSLKLLTDVLTLMKIYFLAMKGKRCNNNYNTNTTTNNNNIDNTNNFIQ